MIGRTITMKPKIGWFAHEGEPGRGRQKPHAYWDGRWGGWIVEWYGHPIGCFTTLAVAVGWFHDPKY